MAESYSFFPYASDIVLSAFEVIRIADPEWNQVPTTIQYDRAAVALNYMLTAWQADGLQLWARKTTSFTLADGTINYEIGSGGTINVNRPLKIYNAWRHDVNNNTDVPIQIYSEREYNELNNKEQTGTPIGLYYNPRWESNSVQEGSTGKGLISIYMPADATAAAAYTIFINYQRPFNDFTTSTIYVNAGATGSPTYPGTRFTGASTDTLDFPREWYEAIKYGLAVRLASVYGMPMLEYDRLKKMADDLKEQAMGFDTEWESLKIQPRQQ